MNNDNGKCEGISPSVDAEVRFDVGVSKSIDENIVEFDVPDVASLFQAIESFMQMTSARGPSSYPGGCFMKIVSSSSPFREAPMILI